MEATRQIYWNIGHGVVILMYLLVFAAVCVMVFGFWKRLPVWRQGKRLDRFDCYDERAKRMLGEVFSQVKVCRVAGGGVFHALFFWSFLALLVGTTLVMVQADVLTPLLQVNLLSGEVYKAFSLTLDLAGILALLMLTGLFIRRFVIQPKGLELVKNDYFVLQLLFAILISGFLLEGARMAATELQLKTGLEFFSPGGLLAGQLFTRLTADTLLVTHKILWWFHFALVLGFFCALPHTKLRHIFTTTANAFLAPFEPKGFIATINLEDDSVEQFGATTICDLSWKDIFDADACTSCKRCQDRCPAYVTDKPLSPLKIVTQIGELAESNPRGKLGETLSQDAIWSCTTCRACQDICPANIEHVNKIIEIRRSLTLMEGAFPGDEVRTAVSNIEVNGNPFGFAYASRGDWAEELQLSRLERGADVDVLYFVGCYASFDKRNQTVAKNFIAICKAAGVKIGILGKEEKCCGEPVRKLGNEYLYQVAAHENIQRIKDYNVKKIVTTCPHCFNTLARDYRDLGLDIPVEHYSTYISGLLDTGRLRLASKPFSFTYHDSCYLGRYMDIIEQPRNILRQAGGSLVEMDQNGYDSFCCGAGGGRIIAEEKLGGKISAVRVKMALDTGAPLLVSSCPFCLTMFEDGIKTGGAEGAMQAMDLAEIVAERITA